MAGTNRALFAVLSALQREQAAADAAEDLFDAEVDLAECHRLFSLYTTRLQLLRDRDPRLALVANGETWLYAEYDAHFEEKIATHAVSVWAAIRDVVRLQMTSHAGQGLSVSEAIVEFAGEFTGGMDLNTLD